MLHGLSYNKLLFINLQKYKDLIQGNIRLREYTIDSILLQYCHIIYYITAHQLIYLIMSYKRKHKMLRLFYTINNRIIACVMIVYFYIKIDIMVTIEFNINLF